MGGTPLIVAIKCVGKGGGRERGKGVCVCGCDCVGVIVYVGVGMIVWVRKGVRGWQQS